MADDIWDLIVERKKQINHLKPKIKSRYKCRSDRLKAMRQKLNYIKKKELEEEQILNSDKEC